MAAPKAIECPHAPSTRSRPPRICRGPHSAYSDSLSGGSSENTLVPVANSITARTAATVAAAARTRTTKSADTRARTSRPQTYGRTHSSRAMTVAESVAPFMANSATIRVTNTAITVSTGCSRMSLSPATTARSVIAVTTDQKKPTFAPTQTGRKNSASAQAITVARGAARNSRSASTAEQAPTAARTRFPPITPRPPLHAPAPWRAPAPCAPTSARAYPPPGRRAAAAARLTRDP